MADRDILTRDDLLILLIEECGEVIQAATKCLRFGWDRHQPGYGINNEALSAEIGDVFGVVDGLRVHGLGDAIIRKSAAGKLAKAARVKLELCHV